MKIALEYNHLNALEYLIVNREEELREIRESIEAIDANQFQKISCDKVNLGKIYYDQTAMNKEIKNKLNACGWGELRVNYYVTGDENITREVALETDINTQKQKIEEAGLVAYGTSNQVDFLKNDVAIEVQFGKYFSVAYDLHVKHTFFYTRNEIDVGIEIIPTKNLEMHMDTGVPWFENEVTNVIREGRTNPPVPIYIVGIEPDEIRSTDPNDYSQAELSVILQKSNKDKFIAQIEKFGNINEATIRRIECYRELLEEII